MQQINAIFIRALAVLLASLGITCAQGTIHVTFDGPPDMPPGSSLQWGLYSESGVGTHALSGYFMRRWSGAPLFPDNGTAYIQPSGGDELFFDYWGSGKRFAAVSVDLALYSASSLDPVTVQFVASGYRRGTDIIATTQFTVSGAVDSQGRPLFQTFYFPPEFTGMYYLSVMPTAPLWSLDNLVVYIPEPSSAALMCAGAVLLAASRFHLRRARRTRSVIGKFTVEWRECWKTRNLIPKG
jgi:hypothetical protein